MGHATTHAAGNGWRTADSVVRRPTTDDRTDTERIDGTSGDGRHV